jgi:hypothetical protein
MAPALKVLVCSTLLAAAGVQAFAPAAVARVGSTSRVASFNAATAPRYSSSSSSRAVSSIRMAAPDSEDAFRAIAGVCSNTVLIYGSVAEHSWLLL